MRSSIFRFFQKRYHSTSLSSDPYFTKINYEMPEKYRNSFYLANASLFDSANWYLHRAYEIMFPDLVEDLRSRETNYNEDKAIRTILDLIKSMDLCNELLDINFTVKRKNGRIVTLRAYRAHHCVNFLKRPCLGGLRLSKLFRKDHCKALAVLSSYRNSCIGINLAGAHGGIKINATHYTQEELKDALQSYAKELKKHNFCGPNIDILEPDMYTGSEEMLWITNTFGNTESNVETIYSVGKPSNLGGFQNYFLTSSEGIYIVLDFFVNNEQYMKDVGLPIGLKGKTFIIQGLGRTGGTFAAYLEEKGAKCVGVKEIDAYVYNKDGISVEGIISHKNKTGSILNFCENVKPYEVYDVFKEECDILVLAANHKSLQCYLADCVQAKIIVEIANGGVTPSANKILMAHHKLVIPDILMNSGTSLASYFEYMKNIEKMPLEKVVKTYTKKMQLQTLESYRTEQELFFNAMKCIILNTLKEVLEINKKYNLHLDLRTASYINAINKIFKRIFDSKQY